MHARRLSTPVSANQAAQPVVALVIQILSPSIPYVSSCCQLNGCGTLNRMSISISHGTQHEETSDNNGYGYATKNILTSLEKLGYSLSQNDPNADVQIWFDQPQHWNWHKGQYRIGYLPWESTKLMPGWVDIMNDTDEIWTPSFRVADWFREAGVKVPVYVYEHGVDPEWAPIERTLDGPMRFGHFGAEATRKGIQVLIPNFRAAFHDKGNDVQLVLKMQHPSWNVPSFGRLEIINGTVTLERLIELMQSIHVYAYPSFGEGFALTPLQALATGAPVITVPETVNYVQYLEDKLCIDATLRRSPWQKLHPGKMYMPHDDSFIECLRYAYDNYEVLHKRTLAAVDTLMGDYNWITLTDNMFKSLESRLTTSKK